MTIVEATPYASHFQFGIEDLVLLGCVRNPPEWDQLSPPYSALPRLRRGTRSAAACAA